MAEVQPGPLIAGHTRVAPLSRALETVIMLTNTRIVQQHGTAAESSEAAMPNNPSAKTLDVYRLHEAIRCIDAMSQEGLSEIGAIARLTLAWLEGPDPYLGDTIATALRLIETKSSDLENAINTEAEVCGCNHVDATPRRQPRSGPRR